MHFRGEVNEDNSRPTAVVRAAAGSVQRRYPASAGRPERQGRCRSQRAYEAKDWGTAMLHEELSKEPDAPPRARLRLGASLHSLGKYDQALTEVGAGRFGEYGRAAVYRIWGYEADRRSIRVSGKSRPARVHRSSRQGQRRELGFASCRRTLRQALGTGEEKPAPYAYTAENRQFDFWARRMG